MTYLPLIFGLALKEFKIRYRNARLGFLWTFIYPLILMAILNFVFTKVLDIKVENYPLFLLCGLFPWAFLTTSLLNATVSIVDNASLVKKVYFPKFVLPIACILNNTMNFLLSMLLLLILVAITGIKQSSSLIYLPLIMALQIIFIISFSLITSHLYIRFRDIRYLVDILLLIWFYASPVFYPLTFIPHELYPLYIINPMAGIIASYRNIILDGAPPDIGLVSIPIAETIILFAIGCRVAKKYSPTAADYV